MNSGTRLRQEIPTHLEVEDRILFGLTLRQGVVVLIGLAMGYAAYAQLGRFTWPGAAAGGHPPLVIRVAIACIPALISLALAAVQPAGRPLEEWLFALARYAALPNRSVWRPRGTLTDHVDHLPLDAADGNLRMPPGSGDRGDRQHIAEALRVEGGALAHMRLARASAAAAELVDADSPAAYWEGGNEE